MTSADLSDFLPDFVTEQAPNLAATSLCARPAYMHYGIFQSPGLH